MSGDKRRSGVTEIHTALGLAICLVLLLNFAGCSEGGPKKETGTVTGTVKVDGEPVSKGVVSMQAPKIGVGATAKLTDGGNFTMSAPLEVGEYVVCILPPEPAGAVDRPDPKDAENIPEKYRTMNKTDLKATVEIGENTFEFEMKKN